MENVFSPVIEAEFFNEKQVPKGINECKKIDPVSDSLERWAKRATWYSLGIAIFIFLMGAYVGSEADEFQAFLPFAICALIVLAVGSFFSILIRGLSRIVYNTSVTANVALMNAAQKEDMEVAAPNHIVTNPTPPNPNSGAVTISATQNVRTKDVRTVIPIPSGDGTIICPVCGKEQLSTRKVCWSCEHRFADPTSTTPTASTRWFCSYCGTENSTNVSQCKKCGKYKTGT